MTTVRLVDPDELLTVTIDGRDRRAFERVGRTQLGLKGTIQSIVAEEPENYVLWLAWHALTKRHGHDFKWDDFEPRVVEVSSDGGGGDDPDPTSLAATGD